jgi:hypothetical protein
VIKADIGIVKRLDIGKDSGEIGEGRTPAED